MAGKPKQGIDYAGWSVNIFDGDTKIDKLLEAQGWQGFSIYFYLCQMAYKFDGYFYKWSYDDSATTARRMGGGIRSETVKATVNVCFRVGLFHKGLFEEHGILTSKGIQRKYYAVVRSRRVKTVNPTFWLLDAEECPGLCLQGTNEDLQATNADLQLALADLQATNAIESKVKEEEAEEADSLAETKIKKKNEEYSSGSIAFSGAREGENRPGIQPRPIEVGKLCRYFEENCHVFNPTPLKDAMTRCLLDGVAPEVLAAVIDDTALANAGSPAKYAIKIMNDILREKIRDLSTYRARQEQWRQRRNRANPGRRAQSSAMEDLRALHDLFDEE